MKTILEPGEPFVNQKMLDRSEWVMKDTILHDDTFKIHEKNEQEARHLSELYRVTENMTKKELAVVAGVACEKYPFMVMQIVAEYVMRNRFDPCLGNKQPTCQGATKPMGHY